MHRNKSVSSHQFAMVPKADIPRSAFRMQKALKTTFDAGWLVPILCEEVLPGDSWKLHSTLFGRLTTPLAPIMDNVYLDTFAFFVPNRLVWENFQRFMGEQDNPGDSISYLIPTATSPVGGYAACSLYDYFGLPTVGQVDPARTVTHSTLPLRAYTLIYDQWFRDQNLCSAYLTPRGDGPDTTLLGLGRRGKRHDYFTGALPFVQKGPSVTLPLGSTAPVISTGALTFPTFVDDITGLPVGALMNAQAGPEGVGVQSNAGGTGALRWGSVGLMVDLTTATASTINQIRESFQLQRFLERAARGGTRYTEIVRATFGVMSPDARLQRPEYLGGGTTPINVSPIAQTSASAASGTDTPLGNLAAMGTVLADNGFTQSFTEHGYIIMLASVRADLTYQQGLRKHWSRSTRLDFYSPVFAHLGEQAILNKEIYAGHSTDEGVFGYQERYAELRYLPSEITGRFRSTDAQTLDYWHLAQHFTTLPTLDETWIREEPPIDRISAIGGAITGQQFLVDVFFDAKVARAMPLYSVPGLVDHF